jgi:hypothetical protein
MTRRSGGVPVAWASGAAFLAVFGGLALQLRHGRDPAIGRGDRSAAAVAPRRVLIRRVIERRVIVRVIPASRGPAAPTSTPASAPVVTTTAPAAPAPAQAAPAPAPAPTSRSA